MSRVIASFGDAALLLPASLLLFVYLLVLRQVRLAWSFAAALALAGIATILAKLAFHACGNTVPDFDVTSPSGHTSFTTIFYGSLAILLGNGRPRWTRWCAAGGVVLMIVAVGISRVRTGAHTPTEVVLGTAIGALALAVFAVQHRRSGPVLVPWQPAAIGFAAAVLVIGGAHFSLEGRIMRTARHLTQTFDICAEPDRDLVGRPAGHAAMLAALQGR